MGVVYEGFDTQQDRSVAIKVLSPSLGGDLVALLRFNREARTASSLSHPNICRLFDIGTHRGRPFIVMELLAGETVKERLSRGHLETPLVLAIARQVAAGLAAAHSKFIVHRDIKPANVFITAENEVKILDFGLAKHFARLDSSNSTLTVTDPKHTPGTVDYMSPEQLLGQRLDQRSDLFSLGSLLYEVLTGTPPFRATASVETMAGILHRDPPPLPVIPFGAEWGDVIGRLLAKDVDQRYPDAAALLRDLGSLERLTQGQPVTWPRRIAVELSPILPSIAVIPFESGTQTDETQEHWRELEYFRHAIVDELTAGLTRLRGVRLVPPTLALRSRRTPRGLGKLGRHLHADRLLTGSVESFGDRLAVEVTLFNVHSNTPVWTRRYEIGVEDLFTLRDEMVRDVIAEFRLTPERAAGVPRREVLNRRAFHLCLKGRFHLSKRYEGGLLTARQNFEEAIRLDRHLALAHAGLADTYSFLGFYCLMPPRKAFELATSSVEAALDIEPDLADAHVSFGLLQLGALWDWEGAERAFKRAIELDPANALARTYLSWVHVLLGEIEQAQADAEEAQDIDPLSPLLNASAGYTFFLSRAYERAIRECEKALEIDKDFLVAIYVMAISKAQLGFHHDAIEELERAVQLSGGMPFYLGLLGKAYADIKQTAKVHAILQRLKGLEDTLYVPPHCYVYIYAGLGDFDKAFEWQDKAFADGASPFNYFSPSLECLHADPRFKADLRAWGLDV
jgi:serine/threonine protein kinase/tetratricopeptide (TPR) repeat protein